MLAKHKKCDIGVMESRVLDFHIFPFPVHCFCIVKLALGFIITLANLYTQIDTAHQKITLF